MRDFIYDIDIDRSMYKVANFKQYDNGIDYSVRIIKNGVPVDLTGYTVLSFFTNKNGKVYQRDCTVDGSIVTTILDSDILGVDGNVIAEFTLYKDSKRITTFDINFKVLPSSNKDDAVQSLPEWTMVEKLMKLKIDLEALEKNVSSSEEIRKTNEIERIASEKNRVANEKIRVSAEDTRESQESARASAESIRGSNETTRKSNENARISAENTRKSNEVDRQNRFEMMEDAVNDFIRDGAVFTNIDGSYLSVDSVEGYINNLEILGNTYQNPSNLAEIKSVGDKIKGQELYEIPILCTGKNLNKYGNINFRTMSYNDRKKKYPFNLNAGTYTISYKNGDNYGAILDESGNQLARNNGVFTISSKSTVYFYGNENLDYTDIQLEEGTVSTQYEPYKEYKVTILSPVPLEKVDDVVDRIVEKDGIWGVEKNVADLILNLDLHIRRETALDTENTERYTIRSISDVILDKVVVCDKLPSYKGGYNNGERSCIYTHTTESRLDIRRLKTDNRWSDVDTLKQFLNGGIVKYPTTKPTFIPLPHDQQLILKTFANKTNIFSLCEIDPTIKGQVPKSLGATVNTHANQIDNLTRELDRLKKLEETTTSTVVTEGNFITIDETSNGYFSDVKLEGKTLVNLWGNKTSDFSFAGQATFNDITKFMEYTSSTTQRFSNCFSRNKELFKPSTEYTIVTIVAENTFDTSTHPLKVSSSTGSGSDTAVFDTAINIKGGFTGVHTQKIKTLSDITNVKYGLRTFVDNIELSEGKKLKFRIIVLEGDHTQNPPSYFEGLKSVGDGSNEFTISSKSNLVSIYEEVRTNPSVHIRNENGSLIYDATFSYHHLNFKRVNLNEGEKYTVAIKGDNCRALYYNDVLNGTSVAKNNTTYKTFIAEKGAYCERIENSNLGACTVRVDGLWIYKGEYDETKHTPYQEDKKQLLYYDTETQAWKKPILREWDTIETHSDGKYYYHKRSDEKTFNGSEPWYIISVASETSNIRAYTNVTQKNAKKFAKVFCDKLPNLPTHLLDRNLIGIDTNSNCVLGVLKTELVSSDLEGLKTWIKNNPVTIVYELAEEEVYECTQIDLISFNNETNLLIESGYFAPKTTLKVHRNISNVVTLLQEKVSLLENKFVEGLKLVLAGDMQSLAYMLYPNDFKEENKVNMLI